MTLNQAFAKRVRNILKEREISVYRLEQLTALEHTTLNNVMNDKNVKCSNFKTMAIIIRGLGMSIEKFFNDPLFDWDNLETD